MWGPFWKRRRPPTAWWWGLLAVPVAVGIDLGRLPPGTPLPVRIGRMTLVGTLTWGPPPWEDGNCFSVPIGDELVWHWIGRGRESPSVAVVNMHAENFQAMPGALGLNSVHVEWISPRLVRVTDPRVPRGWFRERPCTACFRGGSGDEMLARYPESFARPEDRVAAGGEALR